MKLGKDDDTNAKEDDVMDAKVIKSGYNRLDYSKIVFAEKTVSMQEALKNTSPVKWSEPVLQGKEKVTIRKAGV